MKIFSSLILAVALIFATTTAASAYHLSPRSIGSRLKGTLLFTPQSGTPFKCKVTLLLKTRNGFVPRITLDDGLCGAISFQNLPWGVFDLSAKGGRIGDISYDSGQGGCQQDSEHLKVDGSGIWTLPAGQCISGILRSTPPVTIKK